jgi:hypothetical protein
MTMKRTTKSLVGAAFAAMFCLLSGAAPALGATLEELVKYIQARYPYPNGKLGRDWCYNTETEQEYNWWYVKRADSSIDPQPKRVRNAIRIQTIYDDGSAGNKKFASIFIGLVFSGDHPDALYNLTTSDSITAALREGKAKGLLEPMEAEKCISFEQFLFAYVLPYQLHTIDLNGKIEGPNNVIDYVYWKFAGRNHRVVAVTLVPVMLNPGTVGASPIPGHIIVGFGGGSGP